MTIFLTTLPVVFVLGALLGAHIWAIKTQAKGYALFIDDERFPPQDDRRWIVARTAEEVAVCLDQNGMPEHISFDHDLGDGIPTGYDIVQAFVDSDIDQKPAAYGIDFRFPEGLTWYVHSQNPVGRDNIDHLMRNYIAFKARQPQEPTT